jgi:hypothetical protein
MPNTTDNSTEQTIWLIIVFYIFLWMCIEIYLFSFVLSSQLCTEKKNTFDMIKQLNFTLCFALW